MREREREREKVVKWEDSGKLGGGPLADDDWPIIDR